MKKVGIVILNFNGKGYLEKFLPILLKNTPTFAEVIIADNNSNDDSIAFLQKNYSELSIIQSTENLGFAGGYNYALQNLQHEYFLLLNSDIEVTENWLESLTEYMDKNLFVAAAQPKIKDYNSRDFFEYAGAGGGYIDYLGYPFCRGRLFTTIEKDENQFNDITEVFWASGACMMIRSKVFKELGGFDADFFAHQEEIDLCWRIKNAGYRVMYIPTSTVYHIGGGTLNSENPKKTYLNFRNSLLSIIKNVPKKYLISSFLLRLFFDGLAGIKLFLALKPKHTFAIILAHLSIYKNIFKFLKKRKNIPKELPSCFYTKSIVKLYYIKRKKKFDNLNRSFFTALKSI